MTNLRSRLLNAAAFFSSISDPAEIGPLLREAAAALPDEAATPLEAAFAEEPARSITEAALNRIAEICERDVGALDRIRSIQEALDSMLDPPSPAEPVDPVPAEHFAKAVDLPIADEIRTAHEPSADAHLRALIAAFDDDQESFGSSHAMKAARQYLNLGMTYGR